MSPITIVTTCMGRLSYLKSSLATWLRDTDFPIVVVDYDCPEKSGAWAESLNEPRVSVVRATAERASGRPVFNASRAHNAGADKVTEGFILFVDADVETREGFGGWLRERLAPGRMFTAELRVPKKNLELYGLLAVEAAVFHGIGGFDGEFKGWGLEDCDLRGRLYLHGLKRDIIPEKYLKALPHSDFLRTQHYDEKRKKISMDRNRERLSRKLSASTGKSYVEWMRDPGFHHMLTN